MMAVAIISVYGNRSKILNCKKGEKMSEEKNIEPCELKNLVYEIADLNESAIVVLEKENVTNLNKVITVLKCQEDKINLLLEKLKD